MFLDTTVAVQKLQLDISDTDKEQYKADLGLTAVPAHIQPADAEYTVIAEGVFGKTYRMFTTNSGVLDTDKITDNTNSRSYVVRGREDWSMQPLPHYEFTLVEFEGQ